MGSMTHVPIVVPEVRDGKEVKVYRKTEKDDEFYFRNLAAISIRADLLSKCDVVWVNIAHRHVVVEATAKEILDRNIWKAYLSKQTKQKEKKYYYPVTDWKIINGDPDWASKIVAHYQ